MASTKAAKGETMWQFLGWSFVIRAGVMGHMKGLTWESVLNAYRPEGIATKPGTFWHE